MSLIQIAANAVHARVLNAPDDVKFALTELMSYAVAGAEHMSSKGGWNGRSTLFSWETGKFPAGLITRAYAKIEQMGHKAQLIRKPAPAPLGLARPEVDEFGFTAEYDYQYRTSDELIAHRAIIARVATGGGKSRIANICTARIKRPTLFITTRALLMHQMHRAFTESLAYRLKRGELDLYGAKCGVVGDGIWAPDQRLCVAMTQTLVSKMQSEDPKMREAMRAFLAKFEFVILEEAHEASADGFYEIMGQCTNAVYRLALTATPFMRADEEANMKLHAVSGPIGITVSEKELIDRGVLAKPIFKYIEPVKSDKVARTSGWPRAYNYGVMHSNSRNEAIIRETVRAAKYKLPTMILIIREEHGKLLETKLLEAGVRVRFINGKSSREERQAALDALKAGELDAIIGSTILDVGVDVPAVGLVILAGGGKAEVALRQRIGRGMRRKKNGPNVVFIVDFMDPVNKHLMEHSAQRRGIVENTPGFVEGVLPRGRDFDFTLFERGRQAA